MIFLLMVDKNQELVLKSQEHQIDQIGHLELIICLHIIDHNFYDVFFPIYHGIYTIFLFH